MSNIPRHIQSKVDEIMARNRARFGGYVMERDNAETIGELTTERTRLVAEIDEVVARNGGTESDITEWPAGQVVRYENLQRGLDRLDDGILALRAEREGRMEHLRSVALDPSNRETIAGAEHSRVDTGNETRDTAARTIDTAFRSGSLPDYGAERATALLDEGSVVDRSLAAQWATATGDPAYQRAFMALVADPDKGHLMWRAEELAAYQRVQQVQSTFRAMSLTSNAGGYMVPLTLDPSIILTSAGSINPLRRISRVVQTVTNQWQGVSSAGVTAEWKAEAAQAADASPTLANPAIPVYFGDAFVPYSFEVGMDAASFSQELGKLLVDGADQLMATAYTTGAGTTQPTGIITSLAGTGSEIAAATDDIFAKADVYATQNALPARFSANAQWCANLAIINLMSQMETTNGARLFPELSDGRLLNRQINELSNMDGTVTTTGAVSNFVLLYGDFSNFVIVDRIGTTIELVPHLVGANMRPTGQRGALMWFRTGSDSVNDNAFRVLNAKSAA